MTATPEQIAMARRDMSPVVSDPSAVSRFWSLVDKYPDGCWPYQGNISNGYGRFYHKGRAYWAHRLSVILTAGEIDDQLVVDHICRNRACCNPKHLRLVTARVNVLENTASSAAFYKTRTHCSKGHPYEGRNLVIRKDGVRLCRNCAVERVKAWRRSKSANAHLKGSPHG